MNKIIFSLALGLVMSVPFAAHTATAAENEAMRESKPMSTETRQDIIETRDTVQTGTQGAREEAYDNIQKVGATEHNKAIAAEQPAESKSMIEETTGNIGDYLEDSAITAEVKARFLEQKGLDSLDISVKTVDGVVTLEGVTSHASQVELAENVAQKVKGVKDIRNHLHSDAN